MLDADPADRRGLDQRILHVPKVALYLLVLDLVVGEDGLRGRIPVHQALAAVDQPIFEEFKESGPHGSGADLVHRKPRPPPVATAPHQPELVEDRPLEFILPLLDAGYELVALKIRSPLAFLGEDSLFHHRLRGDAGVVRAGHPQGVVASHSSLTDENVLERIIERMADVKAIGHVRRWDNNAIRSPAVAGFGVEAALPLPQLVGLLLDAPGIIYFRKLSRHFSSCSRSLF